MSLPSRLLGANPSIQVSTLLSGSLSTPSAKGTFTAYTEAFNSIASATGGSSTITFSSIPSTYKHLQVRGLIKASAIDNGTPRVWFNGVTSALYTNHTVYSNHETIGIENGNDLESIYMALATQRTDTFAPFILDIYDYASTSKGKTVQYITGFTNNTTTGARVTFGSGAFRSNDAITSITFTVQQAANFDSATQMSLYGIKG